MNVCSTERKLKDLPNTLHSHHLRECLQQDHYWVPGTEILTISYLLESINLTYSRTNIQTIFLVYNCLNIQHKSVKELDYELKSFLFFPKYNKNSNHWYTAVYYLVDSLRLSALQCTNWGVAHTKTCISLLKYYVWTNNSFKYSQIKLPQRYVSFWMEKSKHAKFWGIPT